MTRSSREKNPSSSMAWRRPMSRGWPSTSAKNLLSDFPSPAHSPATRPRALGCLRHPPAVGGTYYAFRELDCFAEDLSNVA